MAKNSTSFKKGQIANPTGKQAGQQDFVTRARYLLDTLDAGKILDMAQALRYSEKDPDPVKRKLHKEMRSMPARDITIIMRIASAFTMEGGASLERLLDRLLGKPPETLNVDQKINGTIHQNHHDWSVPQIDDWLKETTGDDAPASPSAPMLN